MGKFGFISNFFGTDDEDNVESEKVKNNVPDNDPIRNENKVISMQEKRKVTQSTISLFEPRFYSDSKGIAKKLIHNNAVIVNFDHADNDSIKRIIDFLNGTVFTIDGSIERISEKVFLFTPHNYNIDNDIRKNLEHRY